MNLNFENDKPIINWIGGGILPDYSIEYFESSIEEMGRTLLNATGNELSPYFDKVLPITLIPQASYMFQERYINIYSYILKNSMRYITARVTGLPDKIGQQLVIEVFSPILDGVKNHIENTIWYFPESFPITYDITRDYTL